MSKPVTSLFLSQWCLLALFVGIPVNSLADENSEKLENIRIDIQQTQTDIVDAQNEHLSLEQELKNNEQASSKLSQEILELRKSLQHKRAELETMTEQKSQQEALIQQQQENLATQVRQAYIYGRTDMLKLILNQEDPARISRAIAYHNYTNRSRISKIKYSMEALNKLESLETAIEEQTAVLEEIQSRKLTQLEKYQKARQLRSNILLKLEEFISNKGNTLKYLKEQEKELAGLLDQIKEEEAPSISFFEDIAPFRSLRGKLQWPIRGKHRHRFGHKKKGQDLKWDGHYIEANAGTEIKAISTGKVVYADWFRNLGLLMIIDHGDGYMSLYGHNQNLYKKRGDWVLTDEVIASVGDSGGQAAAGLYFEIRKGASPKNPSLWCKK